jgi:hypothetical protein
VELAIRVRFPVGTQIFVLSCYTFYMKKGLIIIAMIVGVGITYWLISPFFINKRVSQELPAGGEGTVTEDSLVVTLFEDVDVGSSLQSFNDQESVKTFNGIEFTLTPTPHPIVAGEETLLTFHLRIDGLPATDMQTQSGVYGKGVIVHKERLEIVPIDMVRRVTPHGTLEFRTTFPGSGEYKIFTQFKRNDEIITTDFSLSVQ